MKMERRDRDRVLKDQRMSREVGELRIQVKRFGRGF